MVSNWIILTVVAGISSVLFNALNRGTLKDGHDSTVYAWLFELVRFIFFTLLIPLDHFLICGPRTTITLVSLGFTELVGVYLYMKMHSHSELSVSSILSRFRVLLVPIFAFIFLGERLTLFQYLGVGTIFAGCLVVLGMKHIRGTKGIWYAIGFVLVNTISNILIKSASDVASTTIISTAFSFPAAILIPVIMKSSITRIRFTAAHIFKSVLIASIFNIVTMYALVKAYALASAGQVNSVFQGITAISVVVGVLLFNERDHILLKVIGAALTTIGIILLV